MSPKNEDEIRDQETPKNPEQEQDWWREVRYPDPVYTSER